MYDTHCVAHLPIKIPGPDNEFRGDCQYTHDGKQRAGPHGPSHAKADLGGKYVLLGDTFWYRRNPAGVRLPTELSDAWDLSAVARGHRTKTDDQLVALTRWLTDTAADWESSK